MASNQSQIAALLKKYEADLQAEWSEELAAATSASTGRINEKELRSQTREFLSLLQTAAQSGNLGELNRSEWASLKEFLEGVSRSRAEQGFSTSETATFILSFKKPLFARLRKEFSNNAEALANETWAATELLDKLALYTAASFQKTREDIIRRQQEEMLELSTPVVKLWDGILALPMIGTLDSSRTQIVMESLLQRIVETESEIAIIDITGVPTVDTLVAQHLIKTVTAIRLMGAECIISGIRPQIAQTIVHLGIEMSNITTKANLADALAIALQRTGLTVSKMTNK